VAVTGDLLQAGDVAWVPFGGPWAEGALDRMIASIHRIAALDPVRTIPGHGPPVDDVPAAVAATLERYERFRAEPARSVWHAVRRAIVSHLMIQPRSAPELAALPWAPVAARALGVLPGDVVVRALGALAERGVVSSERGVFTTTVPHE
jgi:glyoxylase-like metal-dependent hydrolase (beta-lactamase superfamily II)